MHPVGIPLPREPMPDWLVPLRHTFLALLVSLGLKATTIRGYVPAVDRLCAEVGRQGLMTSEGLDETTLVDIRAQVLTRLSDHSREIFRVEQVRESDPAQPFMRLEESSSEVFAS